MKADLSPTARALRALELLQAQPGVTCGQLAAQLDVTERAARRYIAILREASIPVESARGPYGGYRLGRGIRLPPLMFTATEALGLVMAVLDGSHAAADADDPVGAALGKIIRALPENVGRPAATMRQHASAAPSRGAVRPGAMTTSALVDAIAAQRRVSIGYRSQAGTQWAEDVDPWAVVVRHGRWYLLCHSHRAGAVRTYRVDRIQSVVTCGERFRAPGDLDYVDLLEQHLGAGWEFETRVAFDAPRDEVAQYISPPMGRLSGTGEGARCVLTGTTRNPAMYAAEWLAAIPLTFHVEGGPELRAAVAALTARLTAALGAPPGNDRLLSDLVGWAQASQARRLRWPPGLTAYLSANALASRAAEDGGAVEAGRAGVWPQSVDAVAYPPCSARALPRPRCVGGIHLGFSCHKANSKGPESRKGAAGLRNQHPVERVPVNQRQALGGYSVAESDGKFPEPAVTNVLGQILRSGDRLVDRRRVPVRRQHQPATQ